MENPYLQYTNLIGIPTPFFASIQYNESPSEIHINGVREMYQPFFEVLDRFAEEDHAPLFFEHMRALFNLDDQELTGKSKRYQAGFMRLIRGWFFDSNRPEGAVLKGWAESRFGLKALYHNGILTGIQTPAYLAYMAEKMHPRFHYNSIYAQLDLVYEYVPRRTVWIEQTLDKRDWPHILNHEAYERSLMEQGKPYDIAHDYACAAEKESRRAAGGGYIGDEDHSRQIDFSTFYVQS